MLYFAFYGSVYFLVILVLIIICYKHKTILHIYNQIIEIHSQNRYIIIPLKTLIKIYFISIQHKLSYLNIFR